MFEQKEVIHGVPSSWNFTAFCVFRFTRRVTGAEDNRNGGFDPCALVWYGKEWNGMQIMVLSMQSADLYQV